MKNKPFTYLLIAAVIFLWGIIIYRLIEATGSEDDLPVMNQTVTSKKKPLPDYSDVKDTTQLLLNYKNPFDVAGKKLPEEIPVDKLISKPVIVPITQPKPVMNWGFITYSGYIKNARSKKLLAIVIINGKEYTMTEGETAARIKLIRNYKDSIKVTFDGKSKFIAMNVK